MNSPHLPKLPSVQELLDHPRVRGVVERINRSTLVQRAGSYLDDLRETVAKRAEQFELPSLANLAERFARRLLSDPAAPGPWINATGVVFGAEGLSPALADGAVHAAVQLAGDYHPDAAALRAEATSLFGELIPGTDAVITGSVDAALVLAASALAGGRTATVLTARDEAGAVDWAKLGARSGAVLKVQPLGQPLTDCAAAVAFRAPEATDPPGEPWPSTGGDAVRVDVAPLAGILDPADIGLATVAPIAARLTAGADVVIVDGSGLLAGPACGVIVGKPAIVAKIAAHPLAEIVLADGLVAAMLAATLRVYATRRHDTDACRLALPAWQLVSAPLDNLRQRGARLATILAATPGIASATCREESRPWGFCGARPLTATTLEIALAPHNGDGNRLAPALAGGARPIASRRDGETVVLDMRTVFPRWDQDLVAAVEALGS